MQKRAFFLFIVLAILIIILGRTFRQKSQYAIPATELRLNDECIKLDPYKTIAQLVHNTEDFIFIDIRSTEKRKLFFVKNAHRIELENLLDPENQEIFSRKKPKVLIADKAQIACLARLLLIQSNYRNIYILNGDAGFNNSDNESKRFDYAKMMKEIGGGAFKMDQKSTQKKKVQGGC
jgi:hypothetical protein